MVSPLKLLSELHKVSSITGGGEGANRNGLHIKYRLNQMTRSNSEKLLSEVASKVCMLTCMADEVGGHDATEHSCLQQLPD